MESRKSWLPNGGFQPRRFRPGGIGNWSGHLPFAHDLVVTAKPELLVELGTHFGESYFGFCQTIAEHGITCSCYAVDTWTGEPQAGFYDESVYREVDAYNSANYSRFSYLLRSTFDEAVSNFTDESIDVLHIDGLHTYDAVSHDLSTWLQKVKPGGIVLLHDVMVRHGDFGVWKLWQELQALGKHFAFTHSWGLGVFRKAGSTFPDNDLFTALFDSSDEEQEQIRKFYALCAVKLNYEHDRLSRSHLSGEPLVAQIYPLGANGYSADTCVTIDLKGLGWEHLKVELLTGIGKGRLRIDPSQQQGVIDIAGITIRRAVDGETLWSARGTEVASLSVGGTLMRAESRKSQEFCRYVSYGSDPQLFLPEFEDDKFDQPLLLEIWLRLKADISSLLPILQDAEAHRSQVDTLEASIHDLKPKFDKLTEEAAALAAEKKSLVNERDSLLQEREFLSTAHRKLQADLYVAKSDLKAIRLELEESRARISNTGREISNVHELEAKCRQVEQTLHGVLVSRSWRVTAPMRKLLSRLKPGS